MKLEDFAYGIAKKIFEELEHKHHFKVPEAIQAEILKKVKTDLNSFMD
jgi:hypothetical protein